MCSTTVAGDYLHSQESPRIRENPPSVGGAWANPALLLRACSSRSHSHTPEGRLLPRLRASPRMLQILKCFCFPIPCLGHHKTHSPSEREQRAFSALGEFAVGWTPGEGALHFQSASAEHPEVRYASSLAGTRLKLSTCSNALLSGSKKDLKETQQTRIGLFPCAEDGSQHSPEPCALAGTTARAQHRWAPPLPAAAASLLSATQSLHMPNPP